MLTAIRAYKHYRELKKHFDEACEYGEVSIIKPLGKDLSVLVKSRLPEYLIPPYLSAYDVRHADDQSGVPATIERHGSVKVNYYGTLLVYSGCVLDFNGSDYISIDNPASFQLVKYPDSYRDIVSTLAKRGPLYRRSRHRWKYVLKDFYRKGGLYECRKNL